MAGVAVFVDARLFQLRRVGTAVRIVAVATADLSFSHRHVRRAHELRFSLQMTLAAYFDIGALVEKRSLVVELCELMPVAGFLHHGMAVDARQAAPRVGACFPIGLNPLLVALETRLVLNFGGLSGIFAKIDKPTNASSPSRGDVIASRTVARFARLLLAQSARVE